MKILIENIKQLIQVREEVPAPLRGKTMDELPVIDNAFLLIEDGIISNFGPMEEMPVIHADQVIDAKERMVFPAWVDSHTHLVFPESRYGEFIDKIRGLSYEEIAAKGGGILNSARRLRQMSEDELYEKAEKRLRLLKQYGTGAVEIKSGYGLSTEGELKMLRVIKRLKESENIPVKATFLGAHAVPENMNKADYVRLIVEEMLPEIAKHNLADYVDVFCETGYFDTQDTEIILDAAAKYGLKPKIHINQFTAIGGIEIAVKYHAVSVDHLEVMTEQDFRALQHSDTVATVLPGCSFFIHIPYAPAKEMIERNITLALATDFNPGSAPSWNMNFMVSLACIKQKLTPAQAINAATVNAGYALELQHEAGMIRKGTPARVFLSIPLTHYGELPYYFGINPVEKTIGF